MTMILTDQQLKKIDDIIEKVFPYPSFNPGQFDAIKQSVVAILQYKKHIVLSCPTGVGKSVIAIVIQQTLKEFLKKDYETVVLTTTKGLQDQYNKDFNNILKDLKGRNNYLCHHNLNDKYGSEACLQKKAFNQCANEKCPYFIAKNMWVNHNNIKTTNSKLYLLQKQWVYPELVIIDECHEFDKVVIDTSEIEFNEAKYVFLKRKYKKEFSLKFREILSIFKNLDSADTSTPFILSSSLSEAQLETLELFYNNLESTYKSVSDGLNMNPHSSNLVEYKMILSECKELIDYMRLILTNKDNIPWVITKEDKKVILTPISATFLEPFKNKGKQFIHMSATIGGFEEYCFNLGIDTSDAVFINIDNPIPIKNRTIDISSTISINYKTDIKKVVKPIVDIIQNEKGNGVIHTVSFKLAWDIKKNSPKEISKRMIVSNNREEIMDLLKKKSNVIILSPSIETGYDFKGNLARWQIIAKVPYLNLGDTYTKTKLNIDSNWYSREAVLRIVQSSGRIVRGMDDWGRTYIIDSNIYRLITNYSDMFPDWWLQAIKMD